ncbi:MAG: hypothetical protein HYX73_09935, partial [Acidobacteria bacterium]|nr:hypothetical protein [Acidobacteriota bacterium]
MDRLICIYTFGIAVLVSLLLFQPQLLRAAGENGSDAPISTATAGTPGVSQNDAEVTARRLPREVRFSGVLEDATGQPLTGVQGVTFGLYAEQQGGAALWLESQTVEADAQGRYTVLLGAMRSDGLPQDLFTSNEARWLGVQVNQPGLAEQARVLLVSVPYALKAADAETLGGKPVSAFLLAPSADSATKTGWPTASATDSLPTAAVITGSAGYLPVFTNGTSGDLINSSLFQDGSGNIAIGTTTPGATLDLEAPLAFFKLNSTTGTNASYLNLVNDGGSLYIGRESDTSGFLFGGSQPYA